jgi:hypothetical protein
MSASGYIQSVILCDEVRTEITGKDIAIGVYNGHLILPQIPFVLPSLAVRYELSFRGNKTEKMNVKLEGPDKNAIFRNTVMIQFNDWDKPGAVTIVLAGLIMPTEGTYSFYSKFRNDWELTRTLMVEKINREKLAENWHTRMSQMAEQMRSGEPVEE